MAEEAQFHYNGNKMVKAVMSFMMYIIEVVWLGNHINGGDVYKRQSQDTSYQPGHVLSDRTRTIRQGTSWLWRHVKRRFVPYEAYDKTE